MNIKKIAWTVTAFLIVIAVPVFPEQKGSAPPNNVTGKVKILINRDKEAWAEFEAYEEKGNIPAKGSFHLWLEDTGEETYVDVVYVKVSGAYGWFAGKCTKDTGEMIERWLFLAVHDGGSPGRLVDHIWWEWLPDTGEAETIAREKIENLEKPADNQSIKTGDITVNYHN